jgi:single-strand DNA-binding protein
MASLNKVILMGNLTRDPEMRFTPAGKPVARFGLAVNRIPYTDDQGNRQEGVDFFNIVVFGRQAETAHQYLKKGTGVAIEGKLQSRSWETDEGQKRSAIEVIAQNVQFLPRSGEAAAPRESSGDYADFDVPPIEGGDDMPW